MRQDWAPIVGFSGGAIALGVTGGYLIGFLFASGVVGRLAELGWDRKIGGAIGAMLIGNAVIYLIGVPWLAGRDAPVAYVGGPERPRTRSSRATHQARHRGRAAAARLVDGAEALEPALAPPALDQQLRDLDGVRRRALAQVVGDDPERQATAVGQ